MSFDGGVNPHANWAIINNIYKSLHLVIYCCLFGDFIGHFDGSLTGNPLSTTSNKCLTSDPESPATRTNTDPGTFEYPSTNNRKKSKKLPIILGSGGSVVGVFWIIVGIFAIFRHKAKAAAAMAAASAPG